MTRSDAACLPPHTQASQHGTGVCALGHALYALPSQAPPWGHGRPDIRAFLTHLAVERQVAASTQNAALQALIFLSRHVLTKPFSE